MQISIIVVCYNEEKNINNCLESLINMDFSKDNYEIICVDNLSTDGTHEAIRNLIKMHSNVSMITNPIQNIPLSRNIGIKEARFPYVAFTDADCIVPQAWLSKLVRGYETNKQTTPKLAAVGGTNIAPPGRTRFYDASNIVMKTLLGNRGSTQGKEFSKDKEVDHMPTLNILYEKQAIEKVGCFDEAFRFICEDPDLNYRLMKAGYKIYYISNAEVIHVFKPGFKIWAKRIFRYGWARMQLLTKHPDHLSVIYFIPPMIVILVLSSIFTWISSILMWPLIAYIVMIFFYSVFHCIRLRRIDLLFHVLLFYVITHFSFGLGEIWGIVSSSKTEKDK